MDKNELMHQLSHQIEHAVEDAVSSPSNINRVVGESMRHISAFLELNSSAYLPVRAEEILVQPKVLAPGDRDAVLLVDRTRPSEQSFMVLANSKMVDGGRKFSLYAYQQDNFNLSKTKFIVLPNEVGNEIIRQLGEIVKNEGAILLQCVMAKDYFSEEQANAVAATAPSEPAAPAAPSGGLPPVSDIGLL